MSATIARATARIGVRDHVVVDAIDDPGLRLHLQRWTEAVADADDALAFRQQGIDTPLGDCILTRRRVVDRVTRRSGGRTGPLVTLDDILAACDEIPGLGAVVDELVAMPLRRGRLADIAAPFEPKITKPRGSNDTTVTVSFVDDLAWPVPLGGPAASREIRRTFTFVGRHTPSIDRRSRRLHACTIDVDEVWPVPANYDPNTLVI